MLPPIRFEPPDALGDHPALIAWRTLAPYAPVPSAIEILKRKRVDKQHKSQIYRLHGAAPTGGHLVAKECRERTARIEHFLYESILPTLPVPRVQLRGVGPSENAGKVWLFLDDAGDAWPSRDDAQHRRIILDWAARLHTSAAELPEIAELPDRGPDHYLERLHSGRRRIAEALSRVEFTPGDLAVLQRLDAQLEELEDGWERVEHHCSHLPKTLVHGDLVPKNVRLTAGRRPDLQAFDWETAGCGLPGTDLASMRISSGEAQGYLDRASAAWPGFGCEQLDRMLDIGRLFRLLASIDWIGHRLPYAYSIGRRPVATARKYSVGIDALGILRGG